MSIVSYLRNAKLAKGISKTKLDRFETEIGVSYLEKSLTATESRYSQQTSKAPAEIGSIPQLKAYKELTLKVNQWHVILMNQGDNLINALN